VLSYGCSRFSTTYHTDHTIDLITMIRRANTLFRCISCAAYWPQHWPTCARCWSHGSIIPWSERPRAAVDREIELVSARDLSRAIWQEVQLPAYRRIELRRGAFVVLVGPPGSGKSTMVVRALDSLDAATLLLSIEEPAGPSLAERFARAGARDDRLLICSRGTVDEIAETIRKHHIVALGVDSVQRAMFEARELRHLLRVLPSLAVIFAVSQINRDGNVRGGTELTHEADVVVELEGMKWLVDKSRYQPRGLRGDVLPPPDEDAP